MSSTRTPYRKPQATGRVFVFTPVGMDLSASNVPPAGTRVRKTQPAGCPRNGTMGMTYVEDAETGVFYGLVLLNSLKRA